MKPIKAYHGTNPLNGQAILSSGFFLEGTWFAFEKRYAIKFGGPVVFTVEFDGAGFKGDHDWQFHLRTPLPLKRLIGVEGMEWR